MGKYTLADVEAMKCDTIGPEIAGPVIGMSPQTIRLYAREEPWRIPFNYIYMGSRIKIPRRAFVDWMTKTRGEWEIDNGEKSG
jgi:hypothetical protein